MNARRFVAVAGLVLAATVLADPPGPIDGDNIPTNFGEGNLAAIQQNYTSFGDYSVVPGAVIEGNETDQLLVAKSSSKLYIGITGNLATNGNAWMIGIGVPGRTGHAENRTEGITVCPDGPPWTLQDAAREVIIHDNSLIGDPSDDTWSYGTNGTIFPCDTDYMFAVDIFDNTIHVNKYELHDPNGEGVGTWDPTPDNNADDDAVLYTERDFVAEGGVGDGDDILTSQGFGFGEGGFDNSNLDGVTGTDGSSAGTASTGFEFAIPFTAIPNDAGALLGNEEIKVYVLLVDGVESNCVGENFGYVVNQVLPPIGGGVPCDPPGLIGQRPDLSSQMSCLTVDLSALDMYSGEANGTIDRTDYDDTTFALQSCPTPYGDQQFDPDALSRGGGSELDALYLTSDELNLYMGIPGNLEENGNRLIIWLDNGIGEEGEHILTWDGMGPGGSGMEGDAMPPLESDVLTDALFDYAVAINISGPPPNSDVFVDLWDIGAQSSTYKGVATMESGSGELDSSNDGSNQWGMQVALNNLNDEGVVGCGFFEPACWFDTNATVAAAAETAATGFEFAIPLADLGINPCGSAATIHTWAIVTGNDGWRSNQSIPTQRGDDEEMVWQAQNAATDWYVSELGLPENYYRAVAAGHTTTPGGIVNDCDNNGSEDVCDILNEIVPDCNENGRPDSCDLDDGSSLDCNLDMTPDECQTSFAKGDLNADDAITLADYAIWFDCATAVCTSEPCDPPLYEDDCCSAADFDDDGDVDIVDFSGLQSLLLEL